MLLFILFPFQVNSIVDSTYISKQYTYMEPKKAGQKRFTKITVLIMKFLSNLTFKWKIARGVTNLTRFLKVFTKISSRCLWRHWYINSTTIKNQHTTKIIYWHTVDFDFSLNFNHCMTSTLSNLVAGNSNLKSTLNHVWKRVATIHWNIFIF